MEKKPVWVHGDIAQGNLITENRRLSGVIDFGSAGTGDPACDLVIAWTFFDEESRNIFMDQMELDKDTWDRARGWALWKALITFEQKASQNVIDILLNE
jgi:aminoglycoside phosphotransferase (APT) family kinase protein